MANLLLDLLRVVYNTIAIELTRFLVKKFLTEKNEEKTAPCATKRKGGSSK